MSTASRLRFETAPAQKIWRIRTDGGEWAELRFDAGRNHWDLVGIGPLAGKSASPRAFGQNGSDLVPSPVRHWVTETIASWLLDFVLGEKSPGREAAS